MRATGRGREPESSRAFFSVGRVEARIELGEGRMMARKPDPTVVGKLLFEGYPGSWLAALPSSLLAALMQLSLSCGAKIRFSLESSLIW